MKHKKLVINSIFVTNRNSESSSGDLYTDDENNIFIVELGKYCPLSSVFRRKIGWKNEMKIKITLERM